jgi:predicted DNA-binding protein
MKKDSQFTFRIPSDLKARLEDIAISEGRSVAQICVALLEEGVETYKKKGFIFLHRLLSGRKKNS